MTHEISERDHALWGTTPEFLDGIRRSYVPQERRIPEIQELTAEEIRATREKALAEQAGSTAVASAAEVTA